MCKITDFDTYRNNPYKVEGLEEKSIFKKADVKIVTDTATGKMYEMKQARESATFMDDTLPFTKVYHDAAINIKDFSIPALKVWVFILQSLKPKSYEVDLYMPDLKEFTGYSGASNIYKGIAELLKVNFIARSFGNESKYWINPNKMFNGKRV